MCNKLNTEPIVAFDYSKTDTWNSLTFTITSTSSQPEAKVGDIDAPNYGSNAVDIGRALTEDEHLVIDSTQNRNLVLVRTSTANVPDGTISIDTLDTAAGDFIQLNGASLQNFFKLEDYPYQILPYRYESGITIGTSIKLSEDDFSEMNNWNDGFFFFLGTRAEDKYLRLTSTVRKADEAIPEDVENNIIGLKVTNKGAISARYLDKNQLACDFQTHDAVVKTGWSMIHLTFCPSEELAGGQFIPIDDDILKCAPRRKGILSIYVNGLLVAKNNDFPEFYSKGFSSDKDNQLGVPYCIGWGGGSPGLKNGLILPGNDLIPTELPSYGTLLTLKDLPVEKNFSGKFVGGIQILKLWQTSLNFIDIRKDFNSIAPRYGLKKVQGGRIINKN